MTKSITGWSIISIKEVTLQATRVLCLALPLLMPVSFRVQCWVPPFIAEASDLHPLYTFNALMKYDDDSYLLVGSRHISTASEEFDHITDWAGKNNLRLNPSKIRELMVFRRGGHGRSQPPTSPIICGAERVDSLRVLGVVITHDLSITVHLDKVLSSCASSIYALRALRSHGLKQPLLPR